jgi:WD40 repeat protein
MLDGRTLATSSGGREPMRFWDVERRQELVTLEGGGQGLFDNGEFSPDGNILGVVAVPDRSIHLWRAPSWAEIEKAEATVGNPSTP